MAFPGRDDGSVIAAGSPPMLPRRLHSQAEGQAPFEETEARFVHCMRAPLRRAARIGHADIVIGVPFYNEVKTLPHVVQTAISGLEQFYPDSKSVIVAAGSPAGRHALKAIQGLTHHHNVSQISFLLDDDLLDGKGWGIRAIFTVADKLGADVVLMEADLTSRGKNRQIHGLTPEWLRMLLEPIKSGGMDMVISRFALHPFDMPICGHLAHPLLAAIYDCPIRCLLGGQWGISHQLLRTYLANPRYAWETEISGYGVDSWLATAAIVQDAKICEADLGVKMRRRSGGKSDIVIRQLTTALFQHVVKDNEWWMRSRVAGVSPTSMRLPVFGIAQAYHPEPVEIDPYLLVRKYKAGFNDFYSLYQRVFRTETYHRLETLAQAETAEFRFPLEMWAECVYDLLLAYAFGTNLSKGDLVNSLLPLHEGFSADRALNLLGLAEKLQGLPPGEVDGLVSIVAEKQEEALVDEFRRQFARFLLAWNKAAEALRPPVPSVTYREFIPGVPLIVPTEMTGVEGNLVTANGIYDSIFVRHKADFDRFIHKRLKVSRSASSLRMNLAIKDFLHGVESAILPQSDLSTVEGTETVVRMVFDAFSRAGGLGLMAEVAERLLQRCPPMTLLTKMGFVSVAELLERRDPRDMLALARWTETREYQDGLRDALLEELRPEDFEPTPVGYFVVEHEDFPYLVELTSSAALDKLTCRIVVSNLHKGMGGEFPKLRYVTRIAKDIVEAERFGHIWQRFASDNQRSFARKIINSIEGHWGRDPLSAHNIFEDGNQRILVERLREMAHGIAAKSGGDQAEADLAENLKALSDSYHLALVLPDGKFVTCSAWSWASYSFKGGRASPPPLSTHVERDWSSREFLVKYYKALGGKEHDLEEKIIELIGKGKESDNLAEILLGTERGAERFLPMTPVATISEQPLAGGMVRFAGNPILQPIKEHNWEAKYVLNAGAIRLEGKVYLVYRAFGDDEISRLGLAVSEDGFTTHERLSQPIFEPRGKADRKGCEDPRLTVIGDRIYMAYIVFDGTVAQIALASIGVEDFTNYRWERWHRHGFVFSGFTDKDAVLFPEQFNGKYAMLHRVDPHIWITFSSHLRCPWSRKEHLILAGATSGMMWDGNKIGAGTQPIKTKYGWLLVTHGVDYDRVYRLGVMLLDLADPSRLIYRSPNFVLEPESEWELGKGKKSWTSNVVFTCGAVPRRGGKDILDAGDEVIVYYGAADTVICVATATVGSLVPEQLR